MSPVKYELGIYIPEDAIPHSHRRENLKSYISTSFQKMKIQCSNKLDGLDVLQKTLYHTCFTYFLGCMQ
jgi:hypothetical protein